MEQVTGGWSRYGPSQEDRLDMEQARTVELACRGWNSYGASHRMVE